MSKRDEVLAALAFGPVLKSALLKGRRAPFRVAYRLLVADGLVVEAGRGVRQERIYSGLSDATFPEPQPKALRVRKPDIRLLVKAGHTKEDAVKLLTALANNPPAYMSALEEAREKVYVDSVNKE